VPHVSPLTKCHPPLSHWAPGLRLGDNWLWPWFQTGLRKLTRDSVKNRAGTWKVIDFSKRQLDRNRYCIDWRLPWHSCRKLEENWRRARRPGNISVWNDRPSCATLTTSASWANVVRCIEINHPLLYHSSPSNKNIQPSCSYFPKGQLVP